jgi:DNA-binding PadR family transcriptional regulator
MRDVNQYLPLTVPVFQILLALGGRELHGYAILQEIETRSGGTVTLGTGTLYTAIKRMLGAGLIERAELTSAPGDDDERRRYYRITPLGRRVASAEAARMEALVGLARHKGMF